MNLILNHEKLILFYFIKDLVKNKTMHKLENLLN